MKRIVKKDGKALEYTLICSGNRKNVLLQALPEGKVRVYAPKNARLREMDNLVLSRWEWIINMHASLDLEAKKAEFDPENWCDPAFFQYNKSHPNPHLIVEENGDILFALSASIRTCCKMAGKDVEEVFLFIL